MLCVYQHACVLLLLLVVSAPCQVMNIDIFIMPHNNFVVVAVSVASATTASAAATTITTGTTAAANIAATAKSY